MHRIARSRDIVDGSSDAGNVVPLCRSAFRVRCLKQCHTFSAARDQKIAAIELLQQLLTSSLELIIVPELFAGQQFRLVQIRGDAGCMAADLGMAGLGIDEYRDSPLARD